MIWKTSLQHEQVYILTYTVAVWIEEHILRCLRWNDEQG